MEKHFYWGMGILLALLCLCLAIGWSMRATHTKTMVQLEQAAQLALEEQDSPAFHLARQAQSRWQQTRKLTAVVADHSPMDEVDMLFAEMKTYMEAQELPHFAACCNQLRSQLQSMYEAHLGTWWNIF